MKRILILLFMVLIIFCSCEPNRLKNTDNDDIVIDSKIPATSDVSNKFITPNPTVGNEVDYKLIKENTTDEYRYYSPDGKKYIREFVAGNDGDYFIVKAFLSDTQRQLGEKNLFADWKKYSFPKGGIWVNNDEVIINGEYIYNTNSNSKQEFNISSVLKEGMRVENYSLNKSCNKIAYTLVGNYKIMVYIYDISDKKWEFACGKDFEYKDTSPYEYNIAWSLQDEIYFDAHYYKLYKYNTKDKTVKLYKDKCTLKAFSPNFKYILINLQNSEKNLIIDIDSGKEVMGFDSKSYSWLNNDMLAYSKGDREIIIHSVNQKNDLKSFEFEDNDFKVNRVDIHYNNYVFYAYNQKTDKTNLYQINYK